jgi:hypothetical protein
VFGAIKRELRRRSAIEPVIGHLKAEGHLGRCYLEGRLKGRASDAANAVLSAVGHKRPTHPRMAEGSFALNPERDHTRLDQPISAHSGFLTDA